MRRSERNIGKQNDKGKEKGVEENGKEESEEEEEVEGGSEETTTRPTRKQSTNTFKLPPKNQPTLHQFKSPQPNRVA